MTVSLSLFFPPSFVFVYMSYACVTRLCWAPCKTAMFTIFVYLLVFVGGKQHKEPQCCFFMENASE